MRYETVYTKTKGVYLKPKKMAEDALGDPSQTYMMGYHIVTNRRASEYDGYYPSRELSKYTKSA